MSDVLELLKKLIARPSVTPNDAGCLDIIRERLTRIDFHCEDFSEQDVSNLWARRGTKAPLTVFAGHTDVVPPGGAWKSDPFQAEIRDGLLHGRGATDMKSGLAAMLVATENFIHAHPNHPGSIAFLITSDEEGPGTHGTRTVIDKLQARAEKIDYCIVGEATSIKKPGDRIRIGRRGSLHGHLTIHGKQGHIAYPEKTRNPIHLAAPAIQTLSETVWDEGNDYFPPTTFQISNIHAGTGALNVVPGTLEFAFNFRFSTAVTVPELQTRVTNILESHGLQFTLSWDCSGLPFLTLPGHLIKTAEAVIQEIIGFSPELSTGGGTSDGRFIAPTGAEVIEIGPTCSSAHEVDEYINIDELEPLVGIYQGILQKLC